MKNSQKIEKRRKLAMNLLDNEILASNPELGNYIFYHNLLDKLCWLLKLHYTDAESARKRIHRLDLLFQQYLLVNRISIEKSRKCFSPLLNAEKLEFHIIKGWHNELSRNPIKYADQLKIGSQLYYSSNSYISTAWEIVQCYYAVLDYSSCLTAAVDPNAETRYPKKLFRMFANHIIGKTRERFLFYPFHLTSRGKNIIPIHPVHCKYKYASYPRDRSKNITDLDKEVQEQLSLLDENGSSSFLDLLYELRIWANYSGLQELLKIDSSGYTGFLMQNLTTIVFFSAGFAELTLIFSLGEEEFRRILDQFRGAFINRHVVLADNIYLNPLYMRIRCYKHLGIIFGDYNFVFPKSEDPIEFIKK